jgi:electron transfer flavoprotein beta subunit
MNIVVCVKQVPDTAEVKIDEKTKNLVREGVPSILNPYDANGMEIALKLKDRYGSNITAISMGPPQASKELEYCLGMGADKAILLCDKKLAGSDTLATGYALSQIIKEQGFDLIICGQEAIDGCTGHVGPIIAENLDIPHFTHVKDFKIEGDKINIIRDTQKYLEEYSATLPVVICVLKDINKPRKSVKTTRKVMIKKAYNLDISRIGLDGSPTRVVQIEMSNIKPKSYVDVDSSLTNWEDRLDYIISGGIKYNKNVKLIRGNPKKIVDDLLKDSEIRKYIEI